MPSLIRTKKGREGSTHPLFTLKREGEGRTLPVFLPRRVRQKKKGAGVPCAQVKTRGEGF